MDQEIFDDFSRCTTVEKFVKWENRDYFAEWSLLNFKIYSIFALISIVIYIWYFRYRYLWKEINCVRWTVGYAAYCMKLLKSIYVFIFIVSESIIYILLSVNCWRNEIVFAVKSKRDIGVHSIHLKCFRIS